MHIPTIEEDYEYRMENIMQKFVKDYELEGLSAEELQDKLWSEYAKEFAHAVLQDMNDFLAMNYLRLESDDMRTKTLHNAKLIVKIVSNKITNKIITESVYDNRIQTFWDKERIKERGIQYFLNMNDVKETLNWNLNGDDSKYQFKWGQSGKGISEGYAYIFD